MQNRHTSYIKMQNKQPNWQHLDKAGCLRLGEDVCLLQLHNAKILTDIPAYSGYVYIVVAEQGELTISIDMLDYQLRTSDCLIVLANHIVTIHKQSDDFNAFMIAMSETFTESLHIDSPFTIRQNLHTNPRIHLDAQERDAIRQFYDMFTALLQQHDNPHLREIIWHLTKAYYYGLGYYIHPHETVPQNRVQEITQQFLECLQKDFKEHHNIKYYADLLHISPKYLSACTIQSIGISGKQCIERQIIHYIKVMLKQSNKSISDLCYELHFDSLSSFGKYFRTHTGQSLREWKTVANLTNSN